MYDDDDDARQILHCQCAKAPPDNKRTQTTHPADADADATLDDAGVVVVVVVATPVVRCKSV